MADATRSLKIVVEEERKGDGYAQAGKDTEQYADKVSAADLKTKQWAETQKTLQVEIDKSKTRIKELHQEVAKTGDTSLFGDIRKEETRIKNLASTLAALAPDVAKAGEQAGSTFVSGITDSLGGQGKTILIGALVGAAAVAAVPVGAAISGAIAGAIGAVGIAGGIFAASKDPTVRSAAAQFGQDISTEFFGSGSAFVEPIRKSLALLDKDFKALDLGKAFAPLADDTEQLANGVGRFATNVMPGLDKAFQKSGPFIHALSDGLGETGSALSQFIDDISRNHGAVEGLRELFSGLDMTVRFLGKSFETLSAINDWVVRRWGDMARVAADLAGALGLPNEKMELLADKADAFTRDTGSGTVPAVVALGDAFAGSAAKGQDLAKAFQDASDAEDKWINKNLASTDATLAVNQGWLDLNENLHKGAKNWDITTQAGIDNTKMLDEQIKKLEDQRQAAIANGDGTAASIRAADRAYDEQLQKLLNIAKQAGDTQAALDKMSGTYMITIREQVQVSNQLTKASAIDRAIDKAIGGRASGGPVTAGTPYWVGEKGPELYVPSSNGRIIPNGGGGGGGGTQAVDVRVSLDPALGGFSGDIAAALMKLLRFEVRTNGGDANLAFAGKTTRSMVAS